MHIYRCTLVKYKDFKKIHTHSTHKVSSIPKLNNDAARHFTKWLLFCIFFYAIRYLNKIEEKKIAIGNTYGFSDIFEGKTRGMASFFACLSSLLCFDFFPRKKKQHTHTHIKWRWSDPIYYVWSHQSKQTKLRRPVKSITFCLPRLLSEIGKLCTQSKMGL